MPRKSYSRKTSNRRYRPRNKRARPSRGKIRAYRPSNKRRQINRSNPISENKSIEGTDISLAVGLNALGNPILNDFSSLPRYLGNEPPLDGGTNLAVANLTTGARGYPIRDAIFNFNPDSNLYQTQGLDDSSMVGRSVYQKMTAAKFLIRWPQPTMNTGRWNGRTTDMPTLQDPLEDKLAWLHDPLNNIMGTIPDTPQDYHLYWGFITTRTGYSDFTTPKKYECTAEQLEHHINDRTEEWFNQRTDRISFIPKTSNTMKIIGSKKLYPPWDTRAGRQPVSIVVEQDGEDPPAPAPDDFMTIEGTIPDTLVKITWPVNKKIHFEKTANFSGDGVNPDGTPVSGTNTFYKNYDQVPFAVIINWNAGTLPTDASREGKNPGEKFTNSDSARTRRVPHVLINDITYYRDQ